MRITISFKRKYKKEYEYADKKDNTSEYICELIKKDRLKQNNSQEDKQEEILKILKSITSGNILLKEKKYQISNFKKLALKNIMNA